MIYHRTKGTPQGMRNAARITGGEVVHIVRRGPS